ncbi:MAG: response regulator [Cyanobacteria bacterium J06639_14]
MVFHLIRNSSLVIMAYILILEDNYLLAGHWQELLQSFGHEVIWCSTVAQALKQVSSINFDLIITEMVIKNRSTLPFTSGGGLTLISQRALGKLPAIPILGVSGHKPIANASVKISLLEIAKDMGVDAALYKPIQPETLLHTVHTLLNCAQVASA